MGIYNISEDFDIEKYIEANKCYKSSKLQEYFDNNVKSYADIEKPIRLFANKVKIRAIPTPMIYSADAVDSDIRYGRKFLDDSYFAPYVRIKFKDTQHCTYGRSMHNDNDEVVYEYNNAILHFYIDGSDSDPEVILLDIFNRYNNMIAFI